MPDGPESVHLLSVRDLPAYNLSCLSTRWQLLVAALMPAFLYNIITQTRLCNSHLASRCAHMMHLGARCDPT